MVKELRKLQSTTGGTFFVSLPKKWAHSLGLERSSIVSIYEASDGKLVIDPRYDVESSPRSVTLKPGPYLVREIIAKYLLGFDIIRVEAKELVRLEVRDIIKKAVSSMIGLEIVEEDYSGIVMQCLLEPSGFPPEKILHRSYSIVAGMHRDVVNSFIEGDTQLAKNVISRDDESNRLYFLLVRILRTVIQNPSLSEKLGVSPIECLDYRLAASMVEAIGDECVRVASKTVELEGTMMSEDQKRLFIDLHTACFQAHEEAVRAFLEANMTLAENVRKLRERIEKIYRNIEEVAKAHVVDILPQTLAVASFIRQIYEHSVDVADLVVLKKD